MDKDLSLKSNDVKLIILICGDSKTGKKTIVKQIIIFKILKKFLLYIIVILLMLQRIQGSYHQK